jgi:hypothetical protein
MSDVTLQNDKIRFRLIGGIVFRCYINRNPGIEGSASYSARVASIRGGFNFPVIAGGIISV